MDKKVVRKKSGKVATKSSAKVLNPTVPISKETKNL